MEQLEIKFKTKCEVAKDCIEFFHGETEATSAETNLALIEVGDLKRKMQILRSVVDKLKLQTKQAEKIAHYMHERIETCEFISENLPKRMTGAKSEPVTVEAKKESKSNGNNVPAPPPNPKKSMTVPKLSFISLDDFERIPKYMRGRLSYDSINASIDEFNSALEARYAFLGKGFQAMASMAMKKRYKEMKSQETRDTRGVFFVVAEDLKSSDTLKSESSRRNIFTILRHLQLIREIRGPQSLVRYAVLA